MKVLIIGSGIAGMSCAIEAASRDAEVIMVSPYPSERAQSVMAAGGINAVIDPDREGDSIASHISDTHKGGCFIEPASALESLCSGAPTHIQFLENLGVVFSRDQSGAIAQRPFGGQSHRRTCYSGSSTGKQIVTALIQKCLRSTLHGWPDRRNHQYSGRRSSLRHRRNEQALRQNHRHRNL